MMKMMISSVPRVRRYDHSIITTNNGFLLYRLCLKEKIRMPCTRYMYLCNLMVHYNFL